MHGGHIGFMLIDVVGEHSNLAKGIHCGKNKGLDSKTIPLHAIVLVFGRLPFLAFSSSGHLGFR